MSTLRLCLRRCQKWQAGCDLDTSASVFTDAAIACPIPQPESGLRVFCVRDVAEEQQIRLRQGNIRLCRRGHLEIAQKNGANVRTCSPPQCRPCAAEWACLRH